MSGSQRRWHKCRSSCALYQPLSVQQLCSHSPDLNNIMFKDTDSLTCRFMDVPNLSDFMCSFSLHLLVLLNWLCRKTGLSCNFCSKTSQPFSLCLKQGIIHTLFGQEWASSNCAWIQDLETLEKWVQSSLLSRHCGTVLQVAPVCWIVIYASLLATAVAGGIIFSGCLSFSLKVYIFSWQSRECWCLRTPEMWSSDDYVDFLHC